MKANKGGGQRGSRSQIPIARLLQRRMLWMSGLAQNYLESEERNRQERRRRRKLEANMSKVESSSDRSDYEDLIHEV